MKVCFIVIVKCLMTLQDYYLLLLDMNIKLIKTFRDKHYYEIIVLNKVESFIRKVESLYTFLHKILYN